MVLGLIWKVKGQGYMHGLQVNSTTQWHFISNYTVSQKKRDTVHPTVSPNINQFSKFFHYQAQQEICNKQITKDSTRPQKRRYTSNTTLWNMNVDKYKQ